MAYKNHKIMALVPARGRSKSIPRKNIAELGGYPLIYHTAKVVSESKFIDRKILSTDDPEIASIGKKFGLEAPFLQPKKISGDKALAIEVIMHALDWLKKKESYVPDILVYLQPTSPFRGVADLDAAIKKLLNDKRADSLVSVTPLPHRFDPIKLMKENDGYISSQISGSEKMLLRQNIKEKFYGRNGPSIFAIKIPFLIAHKKLYSKNTLPYIMNDLFKNIDIDTIDDLETARKIYPLWQK